MDLRRLLSDRIDEFLDLWPDSAPARVLEIACGDGDGSEVLGERLAARPGGEGARLWCTDLKPERVAVCRRRLAELASPRLAFLPASLYRLPVPAGTFHAVAAFNIFHAVDRRRFAAEMHRVLAPGGRVLTYDRVPSLVAVPRFSLIFDRLQLETLASASRAGGGEPS